MAIHAMNFRVAWHELLVAKRTMTSVIYSYRSVPTRL